MSSVLLYGPASPSLTAATAFDLFTASPPAYASGVMITDMVIQSSAAISATVTIGDDSGLFTYDSFTFSANAQIWTPNINGLVLLAGQILTITSSITTTALAVSVGGYYAANLQQFVRQALTTNGNTFSLTGDGILGYTHIESTGASNIYILGAVIPNVLHLIPAGASIRYTPNIWGANVGTTLRFNTDNGSGGAKGIICGYYG